MTEIELREAIIWLEDLKQKHAVTAHWWGACECALAALHEKQEREKGCEFCTGDVNTRANILDGDCGEVYIDMAGRLTAGYDDVKVRFCPMCGRPLTEK